MNDNQSNPKGQFPRYVSWLTIVLALLAIGTFIAVSNPGSQYVTPMGIRGGVPSAVGMGGPMMDTSVYYPNPNPDVPVTDTREFMKVNYSASMRTRDVPGLTRRVETTVRGFSGRIDQESSSAQYGYVTFAVPQSKYEAFRTELESLVGSRFLSVSVSSQNLLPQKVSIEEQQKQADSTLAGYVASRKQLVSAHAATVLALQARTDATAQQELVSENASYAAQLRIVDANIKIAQDWQKAVRTQDQKLLDSVATVTGTVSIQWISLWDTILLYLPGYWIPAIFAVLAFLSFLRDRSRA